MSHSKSKSHDEANRHYQTPVALRHDVHTLAEDARTLIQATIDVADHKVAAARDRLGAALDSGRDAMDRIQTRTVEGARRTVETVRSHPYETLAIAFGIGAILACLMARRD